MKKKAKKIGIIGKKCGMTRIYNDDGVAVPVTVFEVEPNRISQIKSVENDGYSAIQVTVGKKKRNRVSKPEAGHFAKAGVEPGRIVKEFPVATAEEIADYKVGDELNVGLFEEGQVVDATGTSIGKGFSGVIKVHHFQSQDETHGNSLTTRAPGSIGQRQSPGRVFKGKRMARQLGNVQVTIQNQKIVKIDSERNLIMIKGSVPGAPGGYVVIRPAVKCIERGA